MLSLYNILYSVIYAVMIFIYYIIVPIFYGTVDIYQKYFWRCLTALLIGWVMMILLLLISQQIDVKKQQEGYSGKKCKEIMQACILFLSILIYSGVVSFTAIKYEYDSLEIYCHAGSTKCHDYCIKNELIEKPCIDYYVNHNSNHSQQDIGRACDKFRYDIRISQFCWNYFNYDDNMEFTNGILNDNICIFTKPNKFKCIGQTDVNNMIKTDKYGTINNIDSNLKMLTLSDNHWIALTEDNNLMNNLDTNIYSYDQSLLQKFTLRSYSSIQMTDSLFCTLSNSTHYLYCSGNKLRPDTIQGGGGFTCFIQPPTNHLVCWGTNNYRQLDLPDDIRKTPILEVAPGAGHVCVIKDDKSVACWGQNDRKQASVPEEFREKDSVYMINSGGEQTCAINKDRLLVCWGCNQYGQSTPPVPKTEEEIKKQIEPKQHAADAVNGDKDKDESTDPATNPNPDANPGNSEADKEVATDPNQSPKPDADAPNSEAGKDESTDPNPTPSLLTQSQYKWKEIRAGGDHSCGIEESGKLMCWGWNLDKQTVVPEIFSSLTHTMDTGFDHTCAIHSPATLSLFCWGSNDKGETDVPMNFKTDVSAITLGMDFTCAMKVGGQVVCWGIWTLGKLKVPERVEMDALSITTGRDHACAILVGGKIECWGDDKAGQVLVPKGSYQPMSYSVPDVYSFRMHETDVCWLKDSTRDYSGLYCSTKGNVNKIVIDESVKLSTGNYCVMSNETVCYEKNDEDDNYMMECKSIRNSDVIKTSKGYKANIASLECGYRQVCALYTDGHAECMLGSQKYMEAELTVDMAEDVKKIKAGKHTTCVMKSDFKIICVGKKLGNYVYKYDVELPDINSRI